MEFLIKDLESKGYRVEIFDEICFAYGVDDLMMFSWDGAYIANLEHFDKWGNSKLNQKPLPLPYTDEQLEEFWKAVNFLKDSYEVQN